MHAIVKDDILSRLDKSFTYY